MWVWTSTIGIARTIPTRSRPPRGTGSRPTGDNGPMTDLAGAPAHGGAAATAAPPSATLNADLERHRVELTAYCYRMLGSAFEAEDAVQETIIRAWRGYRPVRGPLGLRSWLYRIATNVCLDMLRAQPATGPADGPGAAPTADDPLRTRCRDDVDRAGPGRPGRARRRRSGRASRSPASPSGWPSSRRSSTCRRANARC